MAAIIASWQPRHAFSVMRRFLSVGRIGSGNRPVVNATEWLKPLRAFVKYFGTSPCGVWQSLQVATALWLLFSHPSYWSFMMWQFAHAAGSSTRYEPPFAYTNV